MPHVKTRQPAGVLHHHSHLHSLLKMSFDPNMIIFPSDSEPPSLEQHGPTAVFYGAHTLFFFFFLFLASTFIIQHKSEWTTREVTGSNCRVLALVAPLSRQAAAAAVRPRVSKNAGASFREKQPARDHVSKDGRETVSGQVTRKGLLSH